ncbi:hypothetical protein M0805_009607 [Coniferiporia weirii]|nr:hypothetical protein M0805_009607 [Coniferiporia weirii]
MHFSTLFKATVLSAVLPLAVTASPVSGGTFEFNVTAPAKNLQKRFDNEHFTYYDITTGTTACGATYSNSDFVVALNGAQYGSGGYCYDSITISAEGKTTTAQIVDECPGCPYGGLDLTEGLFEYFADLSVGVLSGSWNFN